MSTRATPRITRLSNHCDETENQVLTRNSSQKGREKSRLKPKPRKSVRAFEPTRASGQDNGKNDVCVHDSMVDGNQGPILAQMVEDTGVSPLRDATNLTPRKRQRLGGNKADLCEKGNGGGLSSPGTVALRTAVLPCAPACTQEWFDATDPDKVRLAKAVLSISTPSSTSHPLCREAQAREVSEHLQGHLLEGTGSAIYVSGPPGTDLIVVQIKYAKHPTIQVRHAGKSMTIHHVVRHLCFQAGSAPQSRPAVVSINCMSVQNPQDIYSRIVEGVEEARLDTGHDGDDPITYPGALARQPGGLESLTQLVQSVNRRGAHCPRRKKPGRGMIVVILDELDHLVCGDQDVLNHLFKLPKVAKSRLILIGIANSIDLTIRTLTTLEAHDCKPTLVTFSSYNHVQLHALLTDRLRQLPGEVFHPLALRLCAKKVAACSGDMRAALEACSAALEECIAGRVHQSTQDAAGQRLVTVGDMSRAVSTILGGLGASSVTVLAIQGLPQHQQLLLCCATREMCKADIQPVLMGQDSPSASKKTNSKTPSKSESLRPRECFSGALQQAYLRECKRVGLKPLSSVEFTSACSTLADIGLMSLGKGHDQLRRITLRASLDDIALALEDCRIFKGILPI